MKSGRGFHESCNEVYVKAFREEMSTAKLRNGTLKYTKEEIDDLFLPQHWEFTKSPWYYGSLVKIYCRDPQLALDVAAVMNDPNDVPVSCAVLRRNVQEKARQMNDATPSPPTDCSVLTLSDSSFVTPSMNGRSSVAMHATTSGAHTDSRLTWAKVIAFKAHAETTNIAERMEKMEELEKGMALLEKMRSVIGDDLYANQVRCLFAALPNFKAFDSAVNIIDVDSAVNHATTGNDDEWRTLNWRYHQMTNGTQQQTRRKPARLLLAPLMFNTTTATLMMIVFLRMITKSEHKKRVIVKNN